MKLTPRLFSTCSMLIAIFLLTNCEEENTVFIEDAKQETFKTVSITEAKEFLLTKQNDELFTKSNSIGLEFDVNLLDYEEILNSSEKILVIPASTKYENHVSRVLLLNINGNIESVVFALYPNSESTENKYSGEIMITDLEGNFKNGYRVQDNVFITQFIQGNSNTKSTYANYKTESSCVTHGICASAPNECIICSVQEIDEVNIQATPSTEGPSAGVEYIYSYDQHEDEGESPIWNYGGGGSGNSNDTDTCEDGSAKDENGNCPPVEDPCGEVDSQNKNIAFKDKIDELKNKTGLKKETGYTQNKDGTFTAGTNLNNGHSVRLPAFNENTVGYVHTHLDNYFTGRVDGEGNPEEKKPIRMFSPRDLIEFFRLLQNAKKNDIPISDIYASMVSGTGIFNLRFVGNVNNIKTNYNQSELDQFQEDFLTYNRKYNKERAFLKFVKNNIGINGVKLYKVKSNGTIKEMTLKANGKLDSVPCPEVN